MSISKVPTVDPVTDPAPARPLSRRFAARIAFVLLVLASGFGAVWFGREALRAWLLPASVDAERVAVEARLAALEQRVADVTDLLRQLGERISANSSAQRVIRDDLLGIGERAALLEDAINKTAGSRQRDELADLLRLDQVELLLMQAQWRLQHAHDRTGALAAYAFAESALAQLAAPQFVSLRQSLAQEHAAIAAAADPYADTARALDAIEQAIASLPLAPSVAIEAKPDRLARILDALVQVRRSEPRLLLNDFDRERARNTLMLNLALARAALERDDQASFRATLARIDAGVRSLYPDSEARAEALARLATLAEQPLAADLPLLGSSLEQLRQFRAAIAAAGG